MAALSPSSVAPFSSVSSLSPCLPELDSDGWLHSKVGRPMVLSLRVNQKVSYPFLPTAHLCTDILACFSPRRRRRDKMSAPREETVHTHAQNTHSDIHTHPPMSVEPLLEGDSFCLSMSCCVLPWSRADTGATHLNHPQS